ncbi:MAG: WD40/YVTN/BNR-like repeat-containing protein [Dehalococcoidia bacterium]
MGGTVRLLVGTKKGGFIYTSDEHRQIWQVTEPILPGWSVHHMAADQRQDRMRIFAGASHWAWGPSVARSDDGGETWEQRGPGLSFPQDMGVSVQNVWNVRPGHADQPGVVYAGVQPAGLFRSGDWGESWAPVDGINRHPYREFWSGTGAAESSLHSIELDPRDSNRMYASISSGGTYVTRDGGKTWDLCSHRALATTPAAKKFLADIDEMFPSSLPPNVDPAATDEMHKLRIDPKNPDRLWGQSHIGVFRSDMDAKNWQDVTEGLPSFHGFPIAVTRREPDAVFVVPLQFEAENFRVCPGQFTVYRTRDSGCTWERLTCGLPGPNDYQSVYREGLDTDGLEQEGVYVGTSNGEVYASADCGDHWQRLPGTLPPILSVTCVVS